MEAQVLSQAKLVKFCNYPVVYLDGKKWVEKNKSKLKKKKASLCGIYVGQSGNGTGFSHNTSVLHGQYHSTNSPHSPIHSYQHNICNLTDTVITLHIKQSVVITLQVGGHFK